MGRVWRGGEGFSANGFLGKLEKRETDDGRGDRMEGYGWGVVGKGGWVCVCVCVCGVAAGFLPIQPASLQNLTQDQTLWEQPNEPRYQHNDRLTATKVMGTRTKANPISPQRQPS